jgi:hypothetical protein
MPAEPRFRDRFTKAEFHPESEMVRQFVELTFANELDIAAHSPPFAQTCGFSLMELFSRCRALASDAANAAADRLVRPQTPRCRPTAIYDRTLPHFPAVRAARIAARTLGAMPAVPSIDETCRGVSSRSRPSPG